MNKKTIQLLKSTPITIKWYNCDHWQKENYQNLYDFVVDEGIKIKKNIVSLEMGTFKISYSYIDDKNLIRALNKIILSYLVYMEDDAKLITNNSITTIKRG
jgi:hypothetical protein